MVKPKQTGSEKSRKKGKEGSSSSAGTQAPQDEGCISFDQFVANLPPIPKGPKINFLPEDLRIFIWSLINKVQDYHNFELCMDHISSSRVCVDKDCVAHFKGDFVRTSTENVKQNYMDIHELLWSIFGDAKLSNSLSTFMGLLKGDLPKEDIDLMRVHVSILPSSLLCFFIIDLVLIPGGLTSDQRSEFFKKIDAVAVEINWMDNLVRDPLLKKIYDNWDANEYLVKYHPIRTHMKLKFFRHALQHCGLERRPPLSETQAYKVWRAERVKQIDRVYDINKSCYEAGSALDVMKIERVLESLFNLSPNFLNRIQLALVEIDMLSCFCINPSDDAAI